jgi:hypothetical protein
MLISHRLTIPLPCTTYAYITPPHYTIYHLCLYHTASLYRYHVPLMPILHRLTIPLPCTTYAYNTPPHYTIYYYYYYLQNASINYIPITAT